MLAFAAIQLQLEQVTAHARRDNQFCGISGLQEYACERGGFGFFEELNTGRVSALWRMFWFGR